MMFCREDVRCLISLILLIMQGEIDAKEENFESIRRKREVSHMYVRLSPTLTSNQSR